MLLCTVKVRLPSCYARPLWSAQAFSFWELVLVYSIGPCHIQQSDSTSFRFEPFEKPWNLPLGWRHFSRILSSTRSLRTLASSCAHVPGSPKCQGFATCGFLSSALTPLRYCEGSGHAESINFVYDCALDAKTPPFRALRALGHHHV